MKLLSRYEAIWSDGRRLVLHATDRESAEDLARRLGTKPGVYVDKVVSLRSAR